MKRWSGALVKRTKLSILSPYSGIVPLEDQEAITLWGWASLHPIFSDYLSHIPNEARRSWADGKRRKLMGVRKGISDYFLAYPSGNYSGYWGELKRNDKRIKPSKEQTEWLERMRLVGFKADIWHGFDDAREKLLAYLSSTD